MGARLGLLRHSAAQRTRPLSSLPAPPSPIGPARSASASGRGAGLPAVGAGLPAAKTLPLPGRRSGRGPEAAATAAAAVRGLKGPAMAANLSRNGPALQDAYVRVVTEKSPTDWWAPGGSGPGGGQEARGHGCAGAPGSATPAPLPVRCRPHRRHPPSRQPRRAWGARAAPAPPLRRPPCWLRRRAAADGGPHTKGISAAVGGSVSPAPTAGMRPWAAGSPSGNGSLPRRSGVRVPRAL